MALRKLSPRALLVIMLLTGIAGICFLFLPYLLFPQFYIPKANSLIGYTSPATIEGWIFMVAGLGMVILTVILRIIRRQVSEG
jgi:hypothetical protein